MFLFFISVDSSLALLALDASICSLSVDIYNMFLLLFASSAWEGEAGATESGCALAGGLSKGLCYVNRKMRESPSIQVRQAVGGRLVVVSG